MVKESTENGETGTQGVMRMRSGYLVITGLEVAGQGLVLPELGES